MKFGIGINQEWYLKEKLLMRWIILTDSESSHDQNVYEYHRVKIIETKDYKKTGLVGITRKGKEGLLALQPQEKVILNKLNELIIEQNHLMKDFELYKKAFKQYVEDHK